MWETCHTNIKDKLRFKHFSMNLFVSLIPFNRRLTCAHAPLRHTSDLDNNSNRRYSADTFRPAQSFPGVVFRILRYPQQLLQLWNWKSATLSTTLRGPVFLVAAARHGWEAAMGALFAESLFCAVSAGFYGAIVQSLRDAEPQWLTGVFLAAVIPVIFQLLEYIMHWFLATPHLRTAAIVSLIIGSFSALFNWYAMRRGTLLIGEEGRSFGSDLYRLPLLFLGFLAVLPRRLAANAKRRSLELLAGARSYLFSA